jgi:hypothetical protein
MVETIFRVFPTFTPIRIKLGTGTAYNNTLGDHNFSKIRRRKRHTLLNGVV